jgi:hypothetical protein
MNLGALIFCAYIVRAVTSSCWVFPFISMLWPSLSLPTDFHVKSVLSDRRPAVPACFWFPHAWYIFPILSVPALCVFVCEVSFLSTSWDFWALFVDPIRQPVCFVWQITSVYIYGYDWEVVSDSCVSVASFPSWVSCLLFFTLGIVHLEVLLVYWVACACCIPSSHRLISSPFEFYAFLTCVCIWFLSSSVWMISLSILCNAGLVDMRHFTLSLSWKILISSSRLKDSFVG